MEFSGKIVQITAFQAHFYRWIRHSPGNLRSATDIDHDRHKVAVQDLNSR